MSDERRRPVDSTEAEDVAGDMHSAEEPQIIEVEGLPDDAPPPSASGSGEAFDDADSAGRELEAQVESLSEDLLRVRAEFENFRKRQDREKIETIRLAAAELVMQLLPVMDNFRRGLAVEAEGDAVEGYREGIRMIYQQLQDVLGKAGLTPVETVGQPFDPTVHEAVARDESADVEPNTVTEEFEPGYLFRQRLLKPARVRVAVARS